MVQLQQTFYVIAIIYMGLQIIFWIGIAVILYMLYQKISQISEHISHQLGEVQEALSHPVDTAAQAGSSFFQSLLNRFTHTDG